MRGEQEAGAAALSAGLGEDVHAEDKAVGTGGFQATADACDAQQLRAAPEADPPGGLSEAHLEKLPAVVGRPTREFEGGGGAERAGAFWDGVVPKGGEGLRIPGRQKSQRFAGHFGKRRFGGFWLQNCRDLSRAGEGVQKKFLSVWGNGCR